MKATIYQVISSSYETADNYLHQESFTFTDKDKAREKFNALRGSAKIDIEGDEDSEVEYSCSEDDYENRYEGSREVGTEMEYDVIVELKEVSLPCAIRAYPVFPSGFSVIFWNLSVIYHIVGTAISVLNTLCFTKH